MTLKKIPGFVKIVIPYILDDPIVGRTLSPIPISLFRDRIIIKNDKLIYESSKVDLIKTKTFFLKDLRNILVKTKTIPGWTKEHKPDYWRRSGNRIELYLVDKNDCEHLLVPTFFLDRGEKRWKSFLSKLCKFSRLPLEKKKESAGKVN